MKRLQFLFLLISTIVFHGCTGGKSEMDMFIDNLMSEMTTAEKIGQLNLPVGAGFVAGESKSDSLSPLEKRIANGEIGGLFGIKGAAQIRALQKIAVEKTRLNIPLIFGLDVIHGYETTFPIPLALSTSWNMEMIEKAASVAASEASVDGISWAFSPMVDISRDPRWGRVAEGAGEDPFLGGEIAKAMVRGYQGVDNDLLAENRLMACVKHYALYGGAEAGRDYNTVDMSRQRMMNEFMLPYKAAALQGAGSFMASFNEFEGIPATANKYLLDDILRKEWGFGGFIVSDYTGISEMVNHGIGDIQTVAARALDAGIDMDMVSEAFTQTLSKSLQEGKITSEQIDIACRRILEAKYKLGLFTDPFRFCNEEKAAAGLFSAENRKFSAEVASESMVLLKNERSILPLSKSGTIAVIGPMADAAKDMPGTWAITSKGDLSVSLLKGITEEVGDKAKVLYAKGSNLVADSLLEVKLNGMMGFVFPGMKMNPVHDKSQSALIREALELARKSDIIVAALGENSNMNGEGASRSNPSIPEPQQELLMALAGTGKPIVLVLFTGRPLMLEWEAQNIDAILNAWFPGSEAGTAIADILFGNINPSGKLTTTFPRNTGQIPLFYNHKNTGRPHGETEPYSRFRSNYIDVINAPLYPFGYGLSYTTFSYSDLVLSATEINTGERITAKVTVKNEGKVDGKEVVQLYIRDIFSTSTRPVKELKGFKKISLKAGESTEVIFEISEDDLKYYNHSLEYVCEPGEFEIMIGPNSADLKKATITVK